MKTYKTLMAFSLPFFLAAQVIAQTALQTKSLVTNLDTPWEILWGPDNHIWMTERTGKVSRVDPSNGDLKMLLQLSDVIEGNERGLMGLAIHPDFPANASVYLAYTYLQSSVTKVKVLRYTWQPDTLINPVIILDNIPGNGTHDGCRLLTDNTYLFITTGDAQNQSTPQDNNSLNGKILRLNLDGTIPSDNPEPGKAWWSKGHRNPQGLVLANGIMYSSEHGPDTDDEVNIIFKKANYGWPNVAGYCDAPGEMNFCQDSNVTEPIAAWTPTLAVAGTDYYSGTLIPEWDNSLLLTALKAKQLRQLKLNATGDSVISQQVYFLNQFGRIRDLCISPSGKVYIATSNRDGRGTPTADDDRIIEISPVGTGTGQGRGTIRIFPNPSVASEPLQIEFPGEGLRQVQLISFSGNLIWEKSVSSSDVIPADRLSAGVYLLRITDPETVYFQKIIVH